METGFGEPCTQLGRALQELPGGHPYNFKLASIDQSPQKKVQLSCLRPSFAGS